MAFEKLSVNLDRQRILEPEYNPYVSTPEQLLALQIARQLDDEQHKTIYLHLCKHTKPEIIREALSFVSDAQARHKGKLFCWKVKQLRNQWQSEQRNPNRVLAAPVKKHRPAGQQPGLFG